MAPWLPTHEPSCKAAGAGDGQALDPTRGAAAFASSFLLYAQLPACTSPPLVVAWHLHAVTLHALQLLQAQQQQTAEAPKGDPRDRFTGYEPVDSEGNPWWEPPDRDIFEGGAWEVGHQKHMLLYVGRVLQTLLNPMETLHRYGSEAAADCNM